MGQGDDEWKYHAGRNSKKRQSVTASPRRIVEGADLTERIGESPVPSRKPGGILSWSGRNQHTRRSVWTGSVGETPQCPLADAAPAAAAACTQSMASTTASAVTVSLGSAISST